MKKVIIQGYPGSFHDQACHLYFNEELEVLPADTFNELGVKFSEDKSIDYAVMAIENSIAGTILQNYRILRERKFRVIGEVYLRIELNLMGLDTQDFNEIKEVHSHPMALNQCLRYLNNYPQIKLVESEDTALTAKLISENKHKHIAALASSRAAEIYGLKTHAKSIEDNKANYTRFFIVQKEFAILPEVNKASIYCRVSHQKGSLLKVLERIKAYDMNLSKLQSFPVLGKLTEYFFHLDIEFERVDDYQKLMIELAPITKELEELGVYNRADISKALSENRNDD